MVSVSISWNCGSGRSGGALASLVQQHEAEMSAKPVAARAEIRRIMERTLEFFKKWRTGFHTKTGPLSRRLLRGCLIGRLRRLRSRARAAGRGKEGGCAGTCDNGEFNECHNYGWVAFVRNPRHAMMPEDFRLAFRHYAAREKKMAAARNDER